MSGTSRPRSMSTKLLKVAERAKWVPPVPMHSLAHAMDEELLNAAFERIRKDAAVGVDGVTKEEYGQELDKNIQHLHQRMKEGRYRHQRIRRVHIPKAPGKTRPIGISTVEDKVVQNALTMVLEAVFEPLFLDCSYGFRPGRGAHDALRAVDAACIQGGVQWWLEGDIVSFFDNLDRKRLMEMLQQRVADKPFLRLVGKCLHVGVLDGEEYTEPERGTVQGSALSPMLGNIYLHHVLDEWVEREVRPRMRGRVHLFRYADDFLIGFEHQQDAEWMEKVLPQRMAEYGLQLHPGKTRLIPFQRPEKPQGGGKGPGTVDFLGFTLHWVKTRTGGWMPRFKTQKARLRKGLKAIGDFCRRHRHEPLKEQHASLCRRIQGHINYFGVNGNVPSCERLVKTAQRTWRKWLRRRSQRTRLTWPRFKAYLRAHPLPTPRVRVQIWGYT